MFDRIVKLLRDRGVKEPEKLAAEIDREYRPEHPQSPWWNSRERWEHLRKGGR